MRIGDNQIQIVLTWQQIRARHLDLNHPLFYEDAGGILTIFAVDGSIVFLTLLRHSIPEDADDISDFVNNFQSSSNGSLYRRTSGSIPYSVISDADGYGLFSQKQMDDSIPVVLASDQTPVRSTITDATGVPLGVEDGVQIPVGTDGILAVGTDYTGVARRLRTTNDGRLVVNSAVSAPPNNTEVNIGYSGNVSGTANTFYVIPSGVQLKIQRFAGGGEASTGGSKVELWWAPNGNTVGIQLIRVGYVSSSNFEFTLDYDAPELGDGIRAIMVRRERFDGGSVELAGFWDGYY